MPGLGTRLLGAALAGYGTGIVSQAKSRREETLLNLRRKWQVEDREASAALTREGWGRQDERTDKTIAAADARADKTIAAADARADAAVHPYIDDGGITRYGRRGDIVGERAPTKAATSEPLVKVKKDGKTVWLSRSQARGMDAPETGKEERLYPIEDPRTGAIIGYQTREEALAKTKGEDTAARNTEAEAEADRIVDDMTGYLSSDEEDLGAPEAEFKPLLIQEMINNPNVPGKILAARLKRRLKGQGESDAGGGAPAPAGSAQPPAEYPNARQAPDGNWYVPDPNSPSGWAMVKN